MRHALCSQNCFKMKFYYDLHIHSALSPCGDDDMTPNNIVNMAKLNGIDIIALSDHNTCGNIKAVSEVAAQSDIVFLPAAEVETAEEIHVLCLFPNTDAALRFDREVLTPSLPDVKNNECIFGRQQILDKDDNETDTDSRYLINATTVTIDRIYDVVKNYDGVAIPAHIDKQAKSLISVLGMADESMGFKTFELSKNAPEDFVTTQFSLKDKDYKYIHDSDAHYLYDMSEAGLNNYFEFDSLPAPEQIIEFLKG